MSEPVPPSHASPPPSEQPSAQWQAGGAGRAGTSKVRMGKRSKRHGRASKTLCAPARSCRCTARSSKPPIFTARLLKRRHWRRRLTSRRGFGNGCWPTAVPHARTSSAPLYGHLAERSPSEPIHAAFEEMVAALQGPSERDQGKKKRTSGPHVDPASGAGQAVRIAKALAPLHEAVQQHAGRCYCTGRAGADGVDVCSARG